jgi:4-diphosphocytidyl-2-C-methyl-D-erythritol kinase
MIVFPNAKINIGLNVVEKRQDGYHNLESCFFPIPWKDALEVVQAETFSFSSSGIDIPGEANIVTEAYQLLKSKFDLPPVAIHLHKNIPIGAGLGGGSADGAFMLRLLNELFELSVSQTELKTYAGQLGSDCPFFIDNQPKFVEGTGDIFSEINLDLSRFYLTVVFPDLHIETQSAFKGLVPEKPVVDLKEILEGSAPEAWREVVKNDFEKTARQEILAVKENLYALGAAYASMSGSGSAVYGLFTKKPDIESIPGSKLIAKL